MIELGQFTLIALGSNENSIWGDATITIQKAMHAVASLAESDVISSHLYQTPAFPKKSGPDFVNAVMGLYTNASSEKILSKLHAIEAEAGRERKHRWGQRTLDLDLIAVGNSVFPNLATYVAWRDLPISEQRQRAPDQLILPHPRLQDRAFVLVPLADVAPDWVHPVLGESVTALLRKCPAEDLAAITRLDAPDHGPP